MKSMKIFLAVASLAASGVAYANVNTFDGISGYGGPGTYIENGIYAISASGVFWAWPTAGQIHFDIGEFAGDTVDFWFGATPFDLVSMDVSFATKFAVGNLTAFDSSNVAFQTGNFGANSLGTVSFSGWTGISRLRLVATGGHFSIDNVVLSPNGFVPEPSTWVMMIAGFGLSGAAMRRRSRRIPKHAPFVMSL